MHLPDLTENQKALLAQRLNGESPARPTRPSTPKATPQNEPTSRPSSAQAGSPPKKIQSMPVLSTTPVKSTPKKMQTSGSIKTQTPTKAKVSRKPKQEPVEILTKSTSPAQVVKNLLRARPPLKPVPRGPRKLLLLASRWSWTNWKHQSYRGSRF